MKYIIFCSCLLLLARTTTTNASDHLAEPVGMKEPATLSRESGHFLILASFRDAHRVDLFVNRMSPQVDKPIKVSTLQLEERTIYRVMIGPFDKKLTRIQNQYASLGLDGIWWFTVNTGDSVHFEPDTMIAKVGDESTIPMEPGIVEPIAVVPVAAEPIAVTAVKSVVTDPVVARKTLKPQVPIQHHLVFCATKANALERKQLCSDDQITEKLRKYVELLAMTDREYFLYCIGSPGEERRLYCTDHSDVRANHMNPFQTSALTIGIN